VRVFRAFFEVIGNKTILLKLTSSATFLAPGPFANLGTGCSFSDMTNFSLYGSQMGPKNFAIRNKNFLLVAKKNINIPLIPIYVVLFLNSSFRLYCRGMKVPI